MSVIYTDADNDAINSALVGAKDDVTRLRAENKSLRSTPDKSVTRWLLSGVAVSLGILAGKYAF